MPPPALLDGKVLFVMLRKWTEEQSKALLTSANPQQAGYWLAAAARQAKHRTEMDYLDPKLLITMMNDLDEVWGAK